MHCVHPRITKNKASIIQDLIDITHFNSIGTAEGSFNNYVDKKKYNLDRQWRSRFMMILLMIIFLY